MTRRKGENQPGFAAYSVLLRNLTGLFPESFIATAIICPETGFGEIPARRETGVRAKLLLN